ncbi:MAG: glycosyltransferase family 4 protein [Actinobacteria bacterium]|nr:glycosyltransferase family 4 protein [Actinomycetota bacterium]
MDIAGEKVSVIPLAADPVYFSNSPRAAGKKSDVVAKYQLDSEFILFVGAIEPSKNIGTLLGAYSSLLKRGFEHQLVLVGIKDSKYYHRLQENFGRLFGRQVRFLGSVPQRELRDLYRKAWLFVYPSLYEGFGLPVLEAMASGTPVITSNVSAIPEVTGDAALLIDPRDKDKLALYIWNLYHDGKARSDLANKGLSRAQNFSWNRCARQTIEVYRQVMESGGEN